ncbi:hypothetical protein A1Q2_02246 [Trichosporon asahii var. asahii CBS 8904]|uniref:V-type proton ATPase subunit C n=1 Tax=Trichosporon asahii var. asahii (strain CBS 8904) TaxID=1220162 RepID=K1WQW4_TRIAC|nr:hypothetical protein A1Q2_02246 [Trichosporon asahii var. asahii CBS 8904]
MPSDLSYWLISVPLHDGDPSSVLQDVRHATGGQVTCGGWEIPDLKAGTLSSLISLSDALPKTDAAFTQTVSKLLDTLRSLVNDDKDRMQQHVRVNDRPVEEYLIPDPQGSGSWRWDKGRWGEGGKVVDVIAALQSEMNTIESSQKQKTQQYQLAKGALNTLQRKQQGNLAQKSLIDVVKKGDLVEGSEYLETLLVAVPKNNIKQWYDNYERLSSMVVPRSSKEVAEDGEYKLVTVTLFKKFHDEFVHKARENKYQVREFKWDDDASANQKEELERLEKEEKELWTVRMFVESVLRYGLPADYAGVIVKPEPKTAVKTLKQLSAQYNDLASGKSKEKAAAKRKQAPGAEDLIGEWANVMEQEYYDFVLFELPKVQFD